MNILDIFKPLQIPVSFFELFPNQEEATNVAVAKLQEGITELNSDEYSVILFDERHPGAKPIHGYEVRRNEDHDYSVKVLDL